MKSMTGFGRASNTHDAITANIEASSVNRKQAEIVIQLPRTYAELEPELRKLALTMISRGRVTISISFQLDDSAPTPVSVDKNKAIALSDALKELSHQIGHPLDITVADILRAPDIIKFEESKADCETLRLAILPAFKNALTNLVEMRAREGKDLLSDTLQRLDILESEATSIQELAPSVITKYRENLLKRLSEANAGIDLNDDRILKEIGIFAERCDISEEITRLRSHFTKFREYIATNTPVGRSLDFLCQEINREFNTIGSKANNATLAQHVVTSKTELEKIREQIQNIE